MRFDYRHGDEVHSVELTDFNDGTFHARIRVRPLDADGGLEAEPTREHEVVLRAIESGRGLLTALVGSSVHDAVVDRDGDVRTVSLRSGAVSLEHLDPHRPGGARRAGAAAGPQPIVSPMPGRVVELLVAQGDRVDEGETVVVVEAMKMANELKSPINGVVRSVAVAPGDVVDAKRPLLVIEPSPD